MVISVSSDDRKIALSTKALEEGDEEAVKEEFEQKQQAQGPSTIGDLLKAAADGQDEEAADDGEEEKKEDE
jgi:predicted RNA-binding protein with RPS1 domain